MRKLIASSIAAAVALSAGSALAAGDLSIRPIELDTLEVAGGEYGFDVSHETIELETGQAYNLEIESPGIQECAWRAPQFLENIYIRRLEIGEVELQLRSFEEIKFEEDGEVELLFVPIRPGTFEWSCRGLEPRGVKGRFVIK